MPKSRDLTTVAECALGYLPKNFKKFWPKNQQVFTTSETTSRFSGIFLEDLSDGERS